MEPTQAILDRLACPVCHGALLLAADGIACQGCGRLYPVVDGLPVLIASRATLREIFPSPDDASGRTTHPTPDG